ncbi:MULTISPECIES: fructoselysine 6-kinase [Aminobacter]|uniref:PfkB domain protein n=2 Tax=Aminobacter TaxID=31988 RepID=A0AAC9AQA7_AMIAI|nr:MULTISPECIES: fructoselysine 6-kinase [Aminobacter]AMS40094.1 PfkB domain protein [Aminobacter aminovorans]MBB3709966.1 sugar/nucleoside kinase (ribokinase family) [Aminobacter aminovorans]MBB6465638.1 sugar/nucleoside kinase (ribokinase family) [Aminobacter lissarensis]
MTTPANDFNGLKVLGLGDNVVDRYLNTGKMYPGGNALNFAVYAKMLGADAAFLGTFGTDAAGRHVRATLEALSVPTALCRIVEGENGHADVRVVDGNREFVFSNKGGVARENPFVPAQADLEHLASFALVHTSCYSHLNPHLAALKTASRLISYDFSYRWQVDDLIGPVAPRLDFAALSAGDVGRERAISVLRETVAHGCDLAVATLGPEGAVAYNGQDFVSVAPKPTQVVDTLGAGDAFITATLLSLVAGGWARGRRLSAGMILAAMERGSEFAAEICRIEGAFGHAAPMPVETPV